jgi:hypothetical protein
VNWMVRRRDTARLAAEGATLMAGMVMLGSTKYWGVCLDREGEKKRRRTRTKR